MSVASLIITKPGGLTSSEALAKGLPIIALNPIPGQEIKNAHFLVQEKAACLVRESEELPSVVQHLLDDPEGLRSMAAHSRRLGKPQAAGETAKLVLGIS